MSRASSLSFPLPKTPSLWCVVLWLRCPCPLPAHLAVHSNGRHRVKLRKTSHLSCRRNANKLPAPPPALCCRIQLKHEDWEEGKAAKEAIPSLRLCAVLPCPLPGQAASLTTLPKPAARCPVPSPPCPYPCLHPRYLLPQPSSVPRSLPPPLAKALKSKRSSNEFPRAMKTVVLIKTRLCQPSDSPQAGKAHPTEVPTLPWAFHRPQLALQLHSPCNTDLSTASGHFGAKMFCNT